MQIWQKEEGEVENIVNAFITEVSEPEANLETQMTSS